MESSSGWGKPLDKNKNITSPTKPKGQDDKQPEMIYVPSQYKPIELALRAREGVFFVSENEKDFLNNKDSLQCENATNCLFSNNGNYLAISDVTQLVLMDTTTKNKITLQKSNILTLQFSPNSNFLMIIDKRDKDKFMISALKIPNLELVHEFETNRFKKENWPYYKFTDDDKLVFRNTKPNVVEVLSVDNKFNIINTIETETPFDFFTISPKKDNLIIACLTCEKIIGYSKTEAKVDIYKYQDVTTKNKKPYISKILDKAQEITTLFSSTGQHLLLWTQTTHDETGKSYYGEHALFYLDITKNTLKKVPLYKGPIHDVAWNPNGKEFIVISGFMPAGSVLFDNTCTPKFEFGKHHKNTIKWSPLSRFICLAGFGNLSGEMEIWDVILLKQIGTCKSNSAVFSSWSPDGRRILTAVLNPRLRVDNGYKIFKYNGVLQHSVDFSKTELYEALWKPGHYQDRAASPNAEKEATSFKEKEDNKPKKLFQPKGSTGAFAAMLKAEKTTSSWRYLNPYEKFDSEVEPPVPEEKKEEPKKKKRIRKKKEKELNELGADDFPSLEQIQDVIRIS